MKPPILSGIGFQPSGMRFRPAWAARLVVVIAVLLALIGCASPQDLSTLGQRLAAVEQRSEELRQRNLALEESLAQFNAQKKEDDLRLRENEQSLRDRNAALSAALEDMRDRVQLLDGKSEEIEYLLKEKTGELGDQEQHRVEKIQRIEATANMTSDRVAHIEQYLGFEVSEDLDLSLASDRLEGEPLSDKELYTVAKRTFDRADYDAARQGFQEILKQFPQSDHADNAQFWIGEAYYREKWFEKAILEYQKVIETYPRGNKVPASLLKQGLAFLNLRDKANARLIFEELTKKFPKSTESSIARKKLLELK